MMEKTFPLVIQVSSGVELMVGEGPISSACALSGMAIPAASSAKAMAEATSNTPSLFLLKTILLLVEGRDACRPALQSSSGPSCAPLGGDASARWPISSHLWHISERRQGGPPLLSGIGRRLGTDEHDPVGAQHLHRQQASARLFLTALGVGPKREAAHRLRVYCTWIASLGIAQRARAAVRERP